MSVAIIGWGSLIWCPGSLKIRTKWRDDGPMLPLEFARVSGDGRLTLVIHPGSPLQRTYWAVSDFDDFNLARENLREREDCPSINAIKYAQGADVTPITSDVPGEIGRWLSTHADVSTAIWTGLTTNWQKRFQTEFSIDNAVRYLEGLGTESELSMVKFRRAKEYLRNAPPAVQTEVRSRMREKGWTDTELPDVLFEGKSGG